MEAKHNFISLYRYTSTYSPFTFDSHIKSKSDPPRSQLFTRLLVIGSGNRHPFPRYLVIGTQRVNNEYEEFNYCHNICACLDDAITCIW